MHNNELYEDVRKRDYCAISAKVKDERVSRSAHTTIHRDIAERSVAVCRPDLGHANKIHCFSGPPA